MNSLLVIILSLFTVLSLSSNTTSLPDIRKAYINSTNESKAKRFFDCVELCGTNKTIEIKGYQAMSNFLQSKYHKNPFKKISLFMDGKRQLEGLITKNPKNIELRYLRLGVQVNAPKFLGYYKNITPDKIFLIDNIERIDDKELKASIFNIFKKI